MKPLLEMQSLESVLSNLPNAGLADARREAFKRLERDGLPSTRHEDWKYTDLAPVIEISNAWAAAGAAAASVRDEYVAAITAQLDIDWLIIRNGAIDVASVETFEQPGVRIRLLSEGTEIPSSAGALSNLNAAFLGDGLSIEIAEDCNGERPIGLLHIDSTDDAVGVSQTRIFIDVAANSRAKLVEYQVSTGDPAHYSNSVIDCALGARAQLNYLRLQDRAATHSHTGLLHAALGNESEFRHAAFDLGGKLIRNDLHIDINAPGAQASFAGLYLANSAQHIDNHTRVDHRVGPARSDQEYRGILADSARCVWNGKAVVHDGADGTDANQANHNLLLSERAEIDAKPELEIYADDVKCSHGTTVGQLDETALFYLRTRGIDEGVARQLLTRAFAQRIVDAAPLDIAQSLISELVAAKLEQISTGSKA